MIRGDRTSNEPWKSGYEIDIDGDDKGGQIGLWTDHEIAVWRVDERARHGKLLVGRWHKVRVEARGEYIEVFLDGTKVIAFQDAAHRRGNICLESENESVKFRNLVVVRKKE